MVPNNGNSCVLALTGLPAGNCLTTIPCRIQSHITTDVSVRVKPLLRPGTRFLSQTSEDLSIWCTETPSSTCFFRCEFIRCLAMAHLLDDLIRCLLCHCPGTNETSYNIIHSYNNTLSSECFVQV
jgi:hypothetical protein